MWIIIRIVQYIKKTIQLNFIYCKKLDELSSQDLLLYDLLDYIDNKFADDLIIWKSVIKYFFFQ